ncbi:MAG TPA: hypothetical protein VMZ28_23065 [Kofleriaceae bacterium]|nr:hypothetical protein [Kofleriaceae bacterium]
MLWLFKRFVDPVAHRQESEEHRKKREVKPAEAAPDVLYRCRVCAYQSNAGEYCPTCLAATMEPVKT